MRLEAPGAETGLNALYMGRGKQHLDNPTTIDHAEPHCTSRELYKGVIDERRGVFDGSSCVRAGARGPRAGGPRLGKQTLSAIPGLKLTGTARAQVSVLPFLFDSVHHHDIGTILDREGIAIRTGHHCA